MNSLVHIESIAKAELLGYSIWQVASIQDLGDESFRSINYLLEVIALIDKTSRFALQTYDDCLLIYWVHKMDIIFKKAIVLSIQPRFILF